MKTKIIKLVELTREEIEFILKRNPKMIENGIENFELKLVGKERRPNHINTDSYKLKELL